MVWIPYADVNPRRYFPFFNYSFLAINIAVFLIVNLRPEQEFERIILIHGLIPANLQYIDIFTSMFLHANFLHLLFNMLFLWITGDNVEDRYGHFSYIIFYLSAGIAAAFTHIIFTREPEMRMVPCIGASGAISGVLGAYWILFPYSRIKFFYWFGIFAGTSSAPALMYLGIWFIGQFIGSSQGVSSVAYWAHIGGFVFGAAVAYLLKLAGFVKGRRYYNYDHWY